MEVPLYLGLGSNLGDRMENLNEALRRLDEVLGGVSVTAEGRVATAVCVRDKVSDFIVTEPQGFESDEMFLNGVVRYILTLPRGTDMGEFAHRILALCKGVERDMGRTGQPEYDSEGRRIYRSRIIDIDILLLGDFHIAAPDLQIPHPRMYERDFVMIPLRMLE